MTLAVVLKALPPMVHDVALSAMQIRALLDVMGTSDRDLLTEVFFSPHGSLWPVPEAASVADANSRAAHVAHLHRGDVQRALERFAFHLSCLESGRYKFVERLSGLEVAEDESWQPLRAGVLRKLLEGTTRGPWRACRCESCGLIWGQGGSSVILSTDPRSAVDHELQEVVPSVAKDQAPRNRTVIAYLMSHAAELVALLEESEAREQQPLRSASDAETLGRAADLLETAMADLNRMNTYLSREGASALTAEMRRRAEPASEEKVGGGK